MVYHCGIEKCHLEVEIKEKPTALAAILFFGPPTKFPVAHFGHPS